MVIYYEQIDSTNRVAKELVTEGKASGTIVRAGMQSAGKGQNGRTFNSPAGGLYFSLLLQPNLPLEQLSLVTLATGVACREVLYSIGKLEARIKWPNDIYLNDKKVAGILCENVILESSETPTVVIGVGLNVNNTVTDFPLEIQSIVTTLFEHLKIEFDLNALLSALVTAIVNNISSLRSDRQGVLARWQRYDYLANKPVVYTAGSVIRRGIGCGITPEGYYRIQDYQGVEHCIVGGQLRPQ
jgi:BirA family biotin operon repressor/biotin-[acetyl-CoA-carboxylase] ligase